MTRRPTCSTFTSDAARSIIEELRVKKSSLSVAREHTRHSANNRALSEVNEEKIRVQGPVLSCDILSSPHWPRSSLAHTHIEELVPSCRARQERERPRSRLSCRLTLKTTLATKRVRVTVYLCCEIVVKRTRVCLQCQVVLSEDEQQVLTRLT